MELHWKTHSLIEKRTKRKGLNSAFTQNPILYQKECFLDYFVTLTLEVVTFPPLINFTM